MGMCSVKKLVIKPFMILNQNEKRKNWFDNWFNVGFSSDVYVPLGNKDKEVLRNGNRKNCRKSSIRNSSK